MICSGFAQALTLLSTVLKEQGASALAIEGYGLRAHRQAITAAGLATPVLGVDDAGARVGQLAGTRGQRRAPDPVAPVPGGRATGRAAPERGAEVGGHGGLLIEDDYDGEFRYDRRPIGALQGLRPTLSSTPARLKTPGPGAPPRLDRAARPARHCVVEAKP